MLGFETVSIPNSVSSRAWAECTGMQKSVGQMKDPIKEMVGRQFFIFKASLKICL
jgi:hypothetical protein